MSFNLRKYDWTHPHPLGKILGCSNDIYFRCYGQLQSITDKNKLKNLAKED